MINIVLIAVAVIVAALAAVLFVAGRQPDRFHYKRTGMIAAAPASVFAQLNDFHKWENWSPWAAMDPDATVTFDGPEAGTGSAMRWDGNKKVGAGRMEIIEARQDEFVRFTQEFYRPMTGQAEGAFTLAPEGDGTRIKWEMTGDNSFAGKLVGLFMNCEKMVGDQIEQGFANMNRHLQAG